MILDCFPFFNELDILEMRLTELYDVVDAFVIVEATKTHKGDDKPLYYAQNRHRFARWNDKVHHLVVGDLPAGTSQAAIWRREIGQRQEIIRMLRDTPDDATVLISDVDEIPRREVVNQMQLLPDDLVVTFDQTLYYYNVNTSCHNLRWSGTRATQACNVKALTPDGIRWSGLRSHEYPKAARVNNAGWHLSYFGDVAHIQKKMTSFLHQELVNDAVLDPDTIARRMSEGLDIWGREDQQQFTIGPATDLPLAIRCDPVKYAQYFHPDWRPEFHEDWYSAEQAAAIATLIQYAPHEGACVEIGCWEGRSTIALAQTIAPRILHCVDHWRGNEEEAAAKRQDHPSVNAARDRDVERTFHRNVKRMTPNNCLVYVQDWREWARDWDAPIAFLHLDAEHDYASVADCLTAIKPMLIPGAIVCGDDAYADGVHRGIRDVFGADRIVDASGRLWLYQHAE